MTRTYKVCVLKPLHFPVSGYQYNVQIWQSVDTVNWCYCGIGKFFVGQAEAFAYMKKQCAA